MTYTLYVIILIIYKVSFIRSYYVHIANKHETSVFDSNKKSELSRKVLNSLTTIVFGERMLRDDRRVSRIAGEGRAHKSSINPKHMKLSWQIGSTFSALIQTRGTDRVPHECQPIWRKFSSVTWQEKRQQDVRTHMTEADNTITEKPLGVTSRRKRSNKRGITPSLQTKIYKASVNPIL